jgi:L-iditol 2-dehydrogenase
VVDVAEERLALAKKFGATDAVNSASAAAPAEAHSDLTQGRGADVAFEAVGVTGDGGSGLRCVRKGGAVTLVGNVSPKIEFPLQIAVTRELSIHGSCASRANIRPSWTCWRAARCIPRPLISADRAAGRRRGLVRPPLPQRTRPDESRPLSGPLLWLCSQS